MRTHSVTYADAASERAVFDRTLSRNILGARPDLFAGLIGRISGTDEVSLIATQAAVQLQSYHETGEKQLTTGEKKGLMNDST